MNLRQLFEAELKRRGIAISHEAATGRYSLDINGVHLLVSLDNLERDLRSDGDTGRISRFVDTIFETSSQSEDRPAVERLFWCLEPSNYEERAEFRTALSDEIDRVLVHVSDDGSRITWVTSSMLEAMQLTEGDATTVAFSNLDRELLASKLTIDHIDGIPLAYFESRLSFKASLMVAPALQAVISEQVGWPVLAVVPNRSFLMLWPASRQELAGRLGSVVVEEFGTGAYPLSTEVYEIGDAGLRAIGSFPVHKAAND